MTTRDYAFIAWNPVTAFMGSSIRDESTHRQVPLDWQPGLIRNCSFAPVPRLLGTTAEDRTSGGQVLNLFAIDRRQTTRRFAFDTVLQHSLESTGAYAAIVLPSANRLVADLDIIDISGGQSEPLVTGRLHHGSTISWFPDEQHIAYQTVDDQIEVVHRETREIVPTIRGRLPAVSPDGRSIAFERDGSIGLWEVEARQERSIKTGQVVASTGLSWSPDGQCLTYGSTHGLTGKEIRFYLHDLETGRQHELPLKYASGLSLVTSISGTADATPASSVRLLRLA
jgi:dipeptidyl aminopeptidase/acylaminoacyl peptidase